ncbi:MAG: Uma2 family endonuclease [Nostoc sp.]|uniref:Uma2 family endonuclease n=1 Tax=Nostoc sp. TaxID=1180 RepID=UPI002FF51A70
MVITPNTASQVIYLESDGQPMADNTKQFRWIVTIKENLEIFFISQSDVFIAGDLFWYPVEGNPNIKQAPDILVVFGRPKGDRGSYKQFEEDNIPPQVVFEILSPGNTTKEMAKKLLFYQRYGVEEYYIYEPDRNELTGFLRSEDWLQEINQIYGWISPRLGIRFELTPQTLEIYRLDGYKFLTPVELDQIRIQERQRAEQERQAKEAALQQLDEERQRYQDLLTRLQERGINPEQLL